MSANAEWLARWTTNDYVRFGELRFRCQRDLFAIAFKIASVCFTSISVLLEAKRLKPLRLEPKRKSATTRK